MLYASFSKCVSYAPGHSIPRYGSGEPHCLWELTSSYWNGSPSPGDTPQTEVERRMVATVSRPARNSQIGRSRGGSLLSHGGGYMGAARLARTASGGRTV